MIIPIKCFTCGKLIGDKYRAYLMEVRGRKLQDMGTNQHMSFQQHTDKVTYLTDIEREKTVEGHVMDELGLKKMCCRRHLLAHVDIE